MRRSFVPLALACLLLASGCLGKSGTANQATSGEQQNQVTPLSNGVFVADSRVPAPELSGTTLDGSHLDLASLKGKVVVVNFWAQWCDPCRAEARNLNAVYAQMKAKGVAFVGVDIKDDDISARAFQRSKQVRYPSIVDPNGELLLKFQGRAPQQPPTTLILDRQGRVAALFSGGLTETQLLGPVESLASEKA